jgi:hypothetical protein
MALLHRVHGGVGPQCSDGYAYLTVLGRGSTTLAWWGLHTAAHDPAAPSTASNARGGDEAVVPANGVEGDGGSR